MKSTRPNGTSMRQPAAPVEQLAVVRVAGHGASRRVRSNTWWYWKNPSRSKWVCRVDVPVNGVAARDRARILLARHQGDAVPFVPARLPHAGCLK